MKKPKPPKNPLVDQTIDLYSITLKELIETAQKLELNTAHITFQDELECDDGYKGDAQAVYQKPQFSDTEFNDLVLKHRRQLHEYQKWADPNGEPYRLRQLKTAKAKTTRYLNQKQRLLTKKAEIEAELDKLDE